jgi:magnesium chelatase subunit I
MGIPSLRAEITLFEAARALAAADARNVVTLDDLETVAVMSLRLRRSPFIDEYLNQQETEDKEIISKLSD